jgi:hypothetical protein
MRSLTRYFSLLSCVPCGLVLNAVDRCLMYFVVMLHMRYCIVYMLVKTPLDWMDLA